MLRGDRDSRQEQPSKWRHTKSWRTYKSANPLRPLQAMRLPLLFKPASPRHCANEALAMQSKQGKILPCQSALAGTTKTAEPHNTLRVFRVPPVML